MKLFTMGLLASVAVVLMSGSRVVGVVDVGGEVVIVKMVDVSLTEYRFEPSEITVSPGDTVRFEQTSSTPHNVEFREVPAGSDLGAAKMGPYLTKPGDTYDVVIDGHFAPGLHNFVCTPHATMGMTGAITIEGS